MYMSMYNNLQANNNLHNTIHLKNIYFCGGIFLLALFDRIVGRWERWKREEETCSERQGPKSNLGHCVKDEPL